jgi:hypothetical protein
VVVRVNAVRDAPLRRPFLDRAFLFFDNYIWINVMEQEVEGEVLSG